MMIDNQWRLVCEDGSVQPVTVEANDGLFVASVDGKSAVFSAVSARTAVIKVASRWPVVEIVAPGERSRAEAIEAERESAFENGVSSMRDAAANLLSLRADACRSTAESRTAFDDRAPIERYAANELSRAAFDVRRITLKM